ncbi:MAG: hypothetical protein ACR2RL_20525 [Gammaproteobacteria bacterium]
MSIASPSTASDDALQSAAMEYTAPDDRYVDFCLWEYTPPASPAGKLRAVNLLNHSFQIAGARSAVPHVCRAIREALGSFRTVWGVKYTGGRLSWELYFYDYGRLERTVSVSRLVEALGTLLACRLRYDERHPYFMFSIDLDEAHLLGGGALDEINIYIGNVGSDVSSGLCYALTDAGLELDNLYCFFDAADHETIVAKLACSAHIELPRLDPGELLWPELLDCKTVVVANKKRCDGLYFSRIDVHQLVAFMRRVQMPHALRHFVDGHAAQLDHLLFDVGYDYVMRDGRIVVLKSSYYGVF